MCRYRCTALDIDVDCRHQWLFSISLFTTCGGGGGQILHSIQCTHRHTILQPAEGRGAAAGRGGSLPAVRSASAQTEVTLRHATTGHRGAVGRGQYNAHPGGHFLHIMVISEALELRFCLLKILFPSISIVYINTENTYLIVVIVIFWEIKQLK